MDDVARCAGPGCGRPLTRPGTGRPASYCGPNCRQAAHRERVRQAEAERQRRVQLAEARAAAARSWRHLEEDATEAADLAGAVVAYAAGTSRHDLVIKLAEFREAGRRVEDLALAYFDATARAAQLAGQPGAGTPARVS